ncbi:MAG: response regulator transcription factor [Chloroflexi bacterium]|jgi:DNA-binding NarL/FixJ family response regulator|nr:response regulator transcription factor [Chloroflexota bacterium]
MSKIRVLLAEDHVVVREGTRELLQREQDIEVVGEAGDGEEAVELTVKLRPDVVIMDIAMPRLNGIEATKQIKELYPAAAVLILTAYDYDQYIFALLDAGAAGYLLKNIRGRELVDAVRAVHAGESVLDHVVTRKVLDRFKLTMGKPGEEREPLSQRELEILTLASRGMSNKAIASELSLSVRTVQAHLGNIFNKLDVGSRTEAVLYGLRRGWFTLEELP